MIASLLPNDERGKKAAAAGAALASRASRESSRRPLGGARPRRSGGELPEFAVAASIRRRPWPWRAAEARDGPPSQPGRHCSPSSPQKWEWAACARRNRSLRKWSSRAAGSRPPSAPAGRLPGARAGVCVCVRVRPCVCVCVCVRVRACACACVAGLQRARLTKGFRTVCWRPFAAPPHDAPPACGGRKAPVRAPAAARHDRSWRFLCVDKSKAGTLTRTRLWPVPLAPPPPPIAHEKRTGSSVCSLANLLELDSRRAAREPRGRKRKQREDEIISL